MPRPRSPNRDKAFELWLESGKNRTLKEIAQELGVSESRVRKWKIWINGTKRRRYQTLPNQSVTRQNRKVTLPLRKKTPKRKRGGQKETKTATSMGCMQILRWIWIPRQELERLQRMDFEDEESIIIDEIILLTSREKQLLESIQKYQDQKNGLSLDGVTRRTVESEGVKGSRSKQVETTTRTRDVFDVIQKLQAELTKVQKEKRQYLSELRILRAQKRRCRRKKLLTNECCRKSAARSCGSL